MLPFHIYFSLQSNLKMIKIITIAMTIFVASAGPVVSPLTTWVRTPEHDSAIIQSERVGGNFAYSTVEGHAYAALNPVIQNVHTPVAVNYRSHPLMAQVPVYVFP